MTTYRTAILGTITEI